MRADRRGVTVVGAVKALVVVAVLLVGTIAGAFAFGGVGAPSVVSSESRFADVDADTTTIRTDVVVENPNPIGVNRENATISHTVELNDVVLAAGTKRGVSLPPGTSTRTITTRMENEQIPEWWVSHVRNDERTVATVDTRVRSPLLGESVSLPRRRTIETDLLSAFNSTEPRPVDADLPFRDEPVLFVNRTSATWGAVSERETPIEATFEVYNPLPVSVPITELGYTVWMNGVKVGNGTTDRPTVLDSGQVTEIGTNVTIDATRLDEWWVTHIRRDQRTTVRVDFYLRADLPVVGVVRLPIDGLTYTTELETDLLGTGAANERTRAGTDPSAGIHPPERPHTEALDSRSPTQFHFHSPVYARSYARGHSD